MDREPMTTGEYHLSKLPPIEDPDREWRYIAEDGRLVRMFTLPHAPVRGPRPVYARQPGWCDRCHRGTTPECDLDLEPTARGTICRFCRRYTREQVRYVLHWPIPELCIR